jgi:hypothetical protein
MLAKIHAGIRVTTPKGVNSKGQPYAPYIQLVGPKFSEVRLYGGSLGDAGLTALVENLKAHAPATGSCYVMLEGLKPDQRGTVGFAADIVIQPVPQELTEWAVRLDVEAMKAHIEGTAGPGPASGGRAASTPRTPAPAPVTAAADELPF